jgi:hypothetical protein
VRTFSLTVRVRSLAFPALLVISTIRVNIQGTPFGKK